MEGAPSLEGNMIMRAMTIGDGGIILRGDRRGEAVRVRSARGALLFISKDKKACGQAAHTARHVAGRSRPFDRPHRRPRSDEARLFYEKTPYVFGKSTRAPEVLSEYFANNTSDKFQINS